MIGYLGGDSDFYCVRRTMDGDLTLVVDFPDHHAMLTIRIADDGSIALNMGANDTGRAVSAMSKIGQLYFDAKGQLALGHQAREVISCDPPAVVLRDVLAKSESPTINDRVDDDSPRSPT